MPETRKPSSSTATIVVAAILVGAVMIAVIGTFLPSWAGLTGLPAIVMQLVFYAVAAIDVAIALWLRAKLRKARERASNSPVQRQ